MSQPRETAARTWTHRSSVLIGALHLLGLLYMSALWNADIQIGDEGVALMSAWRISEGQVPHRDFFEIVPCVSFLPTVLAFKVLGVSLFASRLLSLAYGLALMALTDRLMTRCTRSLGPRLMILAFLIPFGVWSWPMPSHHWAVDLLLLGAGLALFRGLKGGRVLHWGLLAGGLTGAAVLSLQDQGGLFLIAAGLGFFPWIRDKEIRRRLFLGWVGAGGAVALLFLGQLLITGSFGEFLYQTLEFPMTQYKTLPGNRSALLSGWEDAAGMLPWRTFGVLPTYMAIHQTALLVESAVVALLPMAAVGVMILAFVRRWAEREQLCLLLALLIAFLGAASRRYSLASLTWAAPILLVWVGWGLARVLESTLAWRRRLACALIALVTVTSLTYSGARLYHFKGSGRTIELTSQAGVLLVGRSRRNLELERLLAAIEKHVPAGSPLHVEGYLPMINFLTQRPSATRYNFFMHPPYHSTEQAEEVLRRLESRPPPYLVLPAALPSRLDWMRSALSRYTLVYRANGSAILAPKHDAPGWRD